MPKRSALEVLYADGREETIVIRPVGIVAAERHYGGQDVTPIEGTLYAAWTLVEGPKPTFEEWLGSIDAMEEKELDTTPTGAAPAAAPSGSGASSPASPSEPD